jgi:hypothetical protein
MKPKNLTKKHSAALHNHETIQDAQFHILIGQPTLVNFRPRSETKPASTLMFRYQRMTCFEIPTVVIFKFTKNSVKNKQKRLPTSFFSVREIASALQK